MICSGVELPRLEKEIAAADPRRARQSARGVVRRLHAQLARGVGVQQVIAQDAILHHDGALRRQALVVEGRSAESAHACRQQHGVVVDDRQFGRGDRLAQLSREKRCAAPDGVARCGIEDRADQRPRRLRRKNNGNACCVGTRRAPSRRSVRLAASAPTASGDSRSPSRRALDHHPSRCILPSASFASGAAATPA